MKVGTRIIYDQDGEIIVLLGDMEGDVLERKPLAHINHIDLDYGAIDWQTQRILGVDVTTNTPIIETIQVTETEEQRKIRELEEDILLLQADTLTGGIL